ncbi:MAG: DUF308 domain-containing protein [Acidimicrobiales bacterium]
MPEDTTEVPPPPRPAEYEGMDKSTGTALIVLGVVLVGVGILLLANPFAAIWILGVLIGISLIVGGVIEVASGRQSAGPRWHAWLGGGLVIVGGIAAVAWPDATIWVLAVIVGIVLVVSGAVALAAAFAGPSEERGLRLALGGVSLVIGIAVLVWPDATLLVLAILIGLRTLVNGVLAIGIGINVRRLG